MATGLVEKTGTAMVEAFRQAITEQMGRNELSVSEAARRAEMARPYLHRMLRGDQEPSLRVAARLAEALGLELVLKVRKKKI